jgi:type IV pilus assembly protein PilA
MTTQRGFTLIELMIVVAIIAILAAIAISQYQDYVAKAQVSEVFSIADGLKTKVSEAYNQIGACPANGTSGIPLAASLTGKYVKTSDAGGTATSDGGCTLIMTFKANSVSKDLKSKAVTFTLVGVQSGPARWDCTSAIAKKYLPQTCQ